MKILYVTTIGMTMGFFKSFIRCLLDEGHTVEIATNEENSSVPVCYREWGCKIHQISCTRSPLNKNTAVAIKQIKKIVTENHFDIVHCHTPVAAMCTRLACRKVRKQGTRVFYTAHGFHFYKGAPLKNWLIYYPVEKVCAHFTDVLITINQEDYALAQKKMRAKRVEYVPGVGINIDKYANVEVDRQAKRRDLGIPETSTLLLSVGELNDNKNHQVIIRAMASLEDSNIHYILAGKGDSLETLKRLSNECGLSNQVHFLGYREDVRELCAVSDIFCFPSRREGLGLAAIEAMACGLPLLTSNLHGINDYSVNGETGYKYSPDDVDGFSQGIRACMTQSEWLERVSRNNIEVARRYDLSRVNNIMFSIYKK